MSIYAISDLHLSMAPQTEKPMDVFGNRWVNHSERIQENWCKTITDKDTVVVAGDISWGLKLEEATYDLDWLDNLPGHKVLLKGNHDLWWAGITRLNSMYDSITFLQNDAYYVPLEEGKDGIIDYSSGVWICGSRGWITPDDGDFNDADKKIYNREILRLRTSLDVATNSTKDVNATGFIQEEGKPEILGFLHFPPVSDSRSFSGFMQTFEDYQVKQVYYGHVHGEENFRYAIQGNYHGIDYRLISADFLNCCPIKIHN